MMKVPPLSKEPELKKFLDELLRELDKNEKDNLSSVTANHSLLLQSSGAKVFEITVNDAGTLVITKVAGT